MEELIAWSVTAFAVLIIFYIFYEIYMFWISLHWLIKALIIGIIIAIIIEIVKFKINKKAMAEQKKREEEEAERIRLEKEAAYRQAVEKAASQFNSLISCGYHNTYTFKLLFKSDEKFKWPAVTMQIWRKEQKERLRRKGGYRDDEYRNIMRELEQEEKEIYFYDWGLDKRFVFDKDPLYWVENSARIEFIEAAIRSTGLFDGIELTPQRPHEAPYLLAVTGQELPISQQTGIYYSAQAWKNRFRAAVMTEDNQQRQLPEKFFGRLDLLCDRVEAHGYELNEVFSRMCKVYYKEYAIAKTGLDGEDAVQEILDMHAGAFFALYNLRMEFPGKEGDKISVETDALVLAPNGIFAIETKNYGSSGNYKIVVSADGNWYREYPSSDPEKPPTRQSMENPFEQNDRHIAYLERFINELLSRDMAHWVRVKNVVVLANNTVEMDSQLSSSQILTRVGNLYQHLSAGNEQLFTMEELAAVKKALEARNLPPKKYPIVDYRREMKWAVDIYKYLLMGLECTEGTIKQIALQQPEVFEINTEENKQQ